MKADDDHGEGDHDDGGGDGGNADREIDRGGKNPDDGSHAPIVRLVTIRPEAPGPDRDAAVTSAKRRATPGYALAVAVHGISHIAFRTPDPARLRAFYLELLAAEPLFGSHDPIRAGSVILAFFESSGRPADDPDEIAFDADAAGFDAALERARQLGAVQRDPVAPNRWQRFVVLRDPDGRRIELTHDDRGVYWQED